MELSSALLKSFAQVTNDEPEESSAGTAYGTLYVQSDGNYVLLDGGTSLTPVVMATDSRDGDRVVVTIENHVATVTSNITTPSSGYVAIETEALALLAYDEATGAASIANGKTTAYYQTTAPSGTAYSTNDIWFDTDDGYRMYFWNGSAWVSAQFGSGALGDGSVVASTIASEAVTTGKIAAGAVTAVKIDVADLFAQNITATGTITGVTLKAATGDFTGDVTATNIKANQEYDLYVGNTTATIIRADEQYFSQSQIEFHIGLFDISNYPDVYISFMDLYGQDSGWITVNCGRFTVESPTYFYHTVTLADETRLYLERGYLTIEDGNLYVHGHIEGYDEIYLIPEDDEQYGCSLHYNGDDRASGLLSGISGHWLCWANSSGRCTLGTLQEDTMIRGVNVYLNNTSTVVTSDRKIKSDISPLSNKYDDLLDLLIPRAYTVDACPEETHIGFVVDEMEEAMRNAGLDPDKYGLTEYFEDDDTGDMLGGIRYEEIIPILVYEVQELKAQLRLLTN